MSFPNIYLFMSRDNKLEYAIKEQNNIEISGNLYRQNKFFTLFSCRE